MRNRFQIVEKAIAFCRRNYKICLYLIGSQNREISEFLIARFEQQVM